MDWPQKNPQTRLSTLPPPAERIVDNWRGRLSVSMLIAASMALFCALWAVVPMLIPRPDTSSLGTGDPSLYFLGFTGLALAGFAAGWFLAFRNLTQESMEQHLGATGVATGAATGERLLQAAGRVHTWVLLGSATGETAAIYGFVYWYLGGSLLRAWTLVAMGALYVLLGLYLLLQLRDTFEKYERRG